MLALSPAIETAGEQRPRERLLMSAIEHSSVRSGGRFPRNAIEDIPVDSDGRGPCRAPGALEQRIPAAGLDHARQQRDRRGAAGRERRPRSSMQPVACFMSTPYRRRDGSLRHQRIGRRSTDALGPQDRRAEGCRRPGAAREEIHFADPLDPRRRSGTRPARRNGECRGNRSIRSGAAARESSPPRPPTCWHCGSAGRGPARRSRRGRDFRRWAERLPNTTLFSVPA